MRKILVSFIVFGLIMALFNIQVFAENVGVLLDGCSLASDVPPQTLSGRTMLPFRAVFESLGADVGWDDATQTATGVKGSTEIKLTVNNKMAKVNGKDVELDVPATMVTVVTKARDVCKVVGGVSTFVIEPGKATTRLMVPLRFVAENLGVDVEWDNSTRTVFLKDLTKKQNIGIVASSGDDEVPIFTLFEGRYDLTPVFYYNGKKAVFSGAQPFAIMADERFIPVKEGVYFNYIYFPVKGMLDCLGVGYKEENDSVVFSFNGYTYEVTASNMTRLSDDKLIYRGRGKFLHGEIYVPDVFFINELFEWNKVNEGKSFGKYIDNRNIGVCYALSDDWLNGKDSQNILDVVYDHIPLDVFRHVSLHSKISDSEKEEMKAKALEITRGVSGDYEKVKAIAYWIMDEYYYGTTPRGEEIGVDGSDTYIVFKSRVGICETISTVATVMYQTLGYPARVVKTYTNKHAVNEVFVDGRWVWMDLTNSMANKKDSRTGELIYKGLAPYVFFDKKLNVQEISYHLITLSK